MKKVKKEKDASNVLGSEDEKYLLSLVLKEKRRLWEYLWTRFSHFWIAEYQRRDLSGEIERSC